jgi:sugar phosphate isomerase/epimerase
LSGLLFDNRPIADFASAARKIGYMAVELRGTDHQLPPNAKDSSIQKLAEAFNDIEIVNIASHTGNFALLDEDAANEERRLAHRYFHWASDLNAHSVRVWPGWIAAPEADSQHWDRAARHLRWCANAASDLGVKVAIEMHHGTLAESSSGANRLLEAIDHEAIGLILDPANLLQTPEPFGPSAVAPVWNRLLHVHVKDHALTTASDSSAYPYHDYRRHIGKWIKQIELPRKRIGPAWFAKRSLGDGHVPWPSILTELRQRDYAGHLIVESEVGPGMPSGRELAQREYETLTRWLELT